MEVLGLPSFLMDVSKKITFAWNLTRGGEMDE